MIAEIKRILKGEREFFNNLCKINNLNIKYSNNQSEIGVLKDIFNDREYSDYFPFYKNATIVDIGAHYGYFSLFAQKNLDRSSRIIAIEPNKLNFKNLEKNIINCQIDNISYYNFAIGSMNGVSKLYQGKNPNHSIVNNYILANEKYEEVEIKTLESLINELNLEKIDFLKMDCEGAEYSIFSSTSNSIFDRISTISMEFHDLKDKNHTPDDLIEKLIENKFDIVKFHYEKTSMNLNYGKLIGTKKLNNR